MVEGKGRLTAGGREIEGSEPAPTSQSEGIAEEIFTRVLYTATNSLESSLKRFSQSTLSNYEHYQGCILHCKQVDYFIGSGPTLDTQQLQ